MTAAAALALLTVLQTPTPGGPAEGRPLVPSLRVTGSGKVSARPDQAEVQVGVVTQATSAAQALKENNVAMERLLETLKARGIADKDLQTSQFQVTPQYRYDRQGGEPPRITGYRVSNQVRATVRELKSLGKLLDELVDDGANQVQGIDFSVAEPDRYLDEARRKALAEARRKAELYAEVAGVKVGRVLLLSEQEANPPGPRHVGFAARQEAASAVPVAPGELDFEARVHVTYGID